MCYNNVSKNVRLIPKQMVPIQNYKKFFTELVRKHMIIFGPNIATETAASVEGLRVDSSGEVTEISGTPHLILQNLINQYQQLSAPVTFLNAALLFEKYPDIQKEYNQPLPRVKLICALNDDHA